VRASSEPTAPPRSSAFAEGALARRGAPLVLVLGNEREGLGARARAACDQLVAIPGTGAVESLNVSIAASLLVALALRTS
jgi:tRNA G18 (ribose-2'-O)-methylase SpoU